MALPPDSAVWDVFLGNSTAFEYIIWIDMMYRMNEVMVSFCLCMHGDYMEWMYILHTMIGMY